MTSNLHLELKPVAGSSIEGCSQEACQLAYRLRLQVRFRFNGVELFVQPADHAYQITDAYYKAIEPKEDAQ